MLQALKEKSLIEEQSKGKRKGYIARDPQALVSTLDRKKEIVEQILPDLRNLFTTQKNKPKIHFYEGWEEVKQIYLQSLSTEKIIAIGSTKQLKKLDEAFFDKYQKEIKKNKIIFYDILSNASAEKIRETKEMIGDLYQAKTLPSRHQDILTDILIWGDNVAFITLEEPIFGTIVTNPLLAKTFKTVFEVLWEEL